MRTRLCNATDEENLLRSVQDTAVAITSKPTITGGNQKEANVFEVEDATKYLRERLKYAGDEELLRADKKDSVEVNEDGGDEILSADKKDSDNVNEDGGEEVLSEDDKKGNVKANKDEEDENSLVF